MYPEIMVIPMREDLTRLGVEELKTANDVDSKLQAPHGTTLVIVNSICGCAAGRLRLAVRTALQNSARPERLFSVCRSGYGSHRACALVLLPDIRRPRRRWRYSEKASSFT